jgi:hypothetical protein
MRFLIAGPDLRLARRGLETVRPSPCRDSAASVSYKCWAGGIHARRSVQPVA